MRGPTEKPFDPVVSPLFLNTLHEELRRYDGRRIGSARPCPNCDSDANRKNGYQNEPKTVARLVTSEGVEDVGVEVQQYECTDCGRSFQGDLSELFYEGCEYARPIVDLCRFHAEEQSPGECEELLRRMYGLLVSRDTIERYARRFDEPVDDRSTIDIGGYDYSLSFLSFLFGEGDADEPHFVIRRSRAIW